MPLRKTATIMQPSTRGTTRRWIGSMPSTIMASSSSRILRAPRSAAIAEPPAPAISSAVPMGAACCTTASTDADPVKDCAPNCLIRLPTWSAMTAPNGMATRAVGMIVTDAMNHACWMNSRVWNGRLNRLRPTSSPKAKSFPAVPTGASTRLATAEAISESRPGGHGHVLLEGARRWRDAVLLAPDTGFALAAARHTAAGLDLGGDRRQRRQLHVLFGLQLVGVLLLGHADRANHLGVEELPHDRLLGGEQHLARAEHRQVLVVEQADVVGHGARRVDVVGDDQEGGVDLGVQVDDQLVEERGADRVETGVRLVEEHDLGVEDQGAGQTGPLAHAAGDLARQLVLGADQTCEVELLHDDLADLRLALLGVLAEREGDVVVEVHRAEHGAVLEQHPEQLADLVELLLGTRRDVDALDHDAALVRLEQADDGLEEDGLAGPGRAEHDADLAGRDGEGDVAPDQLLAETLGQVLDLDLDTHRGLPLTQFRRSRAWTATYARISPPTRTNE